ncbi:MAG: hypothetical protein AAF447_09600 [Myxococcota bacterium]
MPAVESPSAGADPLALLLGTASQVRTVRSQQGALSIRENLDQASFAHENQKAALDAARSAARRAGRRMPKRLRRFLEITALVSGAALAPLTGGATAAVAIAGMALSMSAEHITKALVDAGLIGEDAARWVTLGLQLTGAIMSVTAMAAGASVVNAAANMGSTVAATAQKVNAIAQSVQSAIEGTQRLVSGTREALRAGHVADAEHARLDADAHSAERDAAFDDIEVENEDLEVFERHAAAVREHLLDAAKQLAEGRLAAVRSLSV